MNLALFNLKETKMTDTADIEIRETSSTHLHERELKGSKSPSFEFSLDVSAANGTETVNTKETEIRTVFFHNLKYWNNETKFLSANNLDNAYFRNIVDMGYDAVPLILDVIKDHPSNIVFALDKIMPGVMEYDDGYISVEDLCNAWISILTTIENN